MLEQLLIPGGGSVAIHFMNVPNEQIVEALRFLAWYAAFKADHVEKYQQAIQSQKEQEA